ncbi:MAG: hypothetical protein ACI9Y7_001611 [Dokdonia sp.]|jgi:hypothetical protein
MIKKNIVFIAFILLTGFITAQEYKVGKIKKEHFDVQLTPEQQDAPAVFLHKDRRTHFEYRDDLDGWLVNTMIHNVVLINSPEGYQYGTHQIPIYKNGRDADEVKKVEAYSYNLAGGKVVREKIEKTSILSNNIHENLDKISLVLPSVRKGTILEYKYIIESTFLRIHDLVIQEDIPVKKMTAKIEIPQFFEYNTFIKGFLEVKPKKSIEQRNENFSEEQKNPFGGRTQRTLTTNFKYNEIVREYTFKDVSTMQEEKFVNNLENYRASLVYELVALEYKAEIKERVSKTWDEILKRWYDNNYLEGKIPNTSFLNEYAETHKNRGAINDRINAAYSYVQKNMNWDGNEDFYKKSNLRKAFKDKVGNSYEINLMLVALLKKVGLNAFPVLASTKEHGVPLYPTREGLDYVLAVVEYKGDYILLDATDKYLVPGLIPERVMNWEGRMILENGTSKPIGLFSKKYAKKQSFVIATINKEGYITGNCRQSFSGNDGLEIRKTLSKGNLARKEEAVKKIAAIETISDVKLKIDDASRPATISFAFVTDSKAELIEEKLFVAPMLFLGNYENPFKSEERLYPIDFKYPQSIGNNITLNIPEGYRVERIPEPFEIQLPDGIGSYMLTFVQNNEKSIQLTSVLKLSSTLVEPSIYNEIKNFYSEIVTKETETIVLVKK